VVIFAQALCVKKPKLISPPPSRFRRHWLLRPRSVFLNHGSFGACPATVLKLQSKLRGQMEAEPVQFLWRHYEERLEPARVAVAGFLGARPQDLVFTTNATTGVNSVLRSIKLRRGDQLLTTSHDYNACRNVVSDAARRAGAKLVIARVPFPLRNADVALQTILQAVTSRTRLALIDHVSSHTGFVLPVARIIRELQARGVDTLVDGAHAPGMISLNIGRLSAAYYTGNLHKWVCAPKGAAFLWVRRDKQSGLMPAVISHGNNTPRPGYSAFQDRFDWAGTFDPTPWLCAAEAVCWLGRLLPGGWPELQQHNHHLAVQARRLLCERWQVPEPCPENLLGAMATIPLPDRFQGRSRSGKIDPEQLDLYDRFGVEVPFVRIGQPPRRYLRISAQIYNSVEEYEYLARALEQCP
jgi:isopenicillin-N epimerase